METLQDLPLFYLFSGFFLILFLNKKILKWPMSIGVTFFGALAALIIFGLSAFLENGLHAQAAGIYKIFARPEYLLELALPFMLFAAAWHTNLKDLVGEKWTVMVLATKGVMLQAVMISGIMWGLQTLLQLAGLPLQGLTILEWSLFGILISATDPVAVGAILKSLGAPASLSAKISGESLFNDGVAMVLFLVMSGIVFAVHGAAEGTEVSAGHVAQMIGIEVVGGIALGLVLGYTAYQITRRLDDAFLEMMLSLLLVFAIMEVNSQMKDWIHEGPSTALAAVIAGLFIGNHAKAKGISEKVGHHMDTIWEFIDEILIFFTFLLAGLALLSIQTDWVYLALGTAAIAVVLAVRYFAVKFTISLLKPFRNRPFTPGVERILTWGGLRGGISIALALSLPEGNVKNVIVTVTVIVVLFSVLIQGLTIKKVVENALQEPNAETETPPATQA